MSIKRFLQENSDEKQVEIVTKTLQMLRMNDSLVSNLTKKRYPCVSLGKGNSDATCFIVMPNYETDQVLILERIVEKVKGKKLSETYMTPFWKVPDKKQIELMAKILLKEISIVNPNFIIVLNEKLGAYLSKFIKEKKIMILPEFKELIEMEKEYKDNKTEELKEQIRETQRDILIKLKGFKVLYNKSKEEN